VYEATGNPAAINSIQLGRDGVLRWRRESGESSNNGACRRSSGATHAPDTPERSQAI
jgi:hypothetical protein